MRVTCKTVSEFIDNLKSEKGNIYRNIIYVMIEEEPLDQNNIKFSITIQVTAVVRTEDGGEYLLVVAENCGKDLRDVSQDYGGNELAFDLQDKIKTACEELGLEVRTGIVSE